MWQTYHLTAQLKLKSWTSTRFLKQAVIEVWFKRFSHTILCTHTRDHCISASVNPFSPRKHLPCIASSDLLLLTVPLTNHQGNRGKSYPLPGICLTFFEILRSEGPDKSSPHHYCLSTLQLQKAALSFFSVLSWICLSERAWEPQGSLLPLTSHTGAAFKYFSHLLCNILNQICSLPSGPVESGTSWAAQIPPGLRAHLWSQSCSQ